MASGFDLGLSGLASGFDWKSFIDQMTTAQRASQTPFRARQSNLQQRNAAFNTIKDKLTALQKAVKALAEPAPFETRNTSVSDASLGSAIAAKGTAAGSYAFQITQLATAAKVTGASDVSASLLSAAEVSTRPISEAGWPLPLRAGTFSINNRQVSVESTDTLQQVFDKISSATENTVSAVYDEATDKIVLTSANPIVLGSATDTSNFLQVARLNNNGTGSVESKAPLGSIRLSASMNASGLRTPITDGGSGAGEFKVNGVSISYNASTDSIATVLNRINSSSAGVSAAYDFSNDRFVFTSKVTGDIGVALEEVSGNFLSATGVTGGVLSRGQDLLYSLNDGPELSSHENTITESSSGISGLSVTALKENTSFTVTVNSDTVPAKAAIQAFIDAYNDVVGYIGTQTASSTSTAGKITAGVLAGDSGANSLASLLRSTAYSALSALPAAMNELSDLGIQTNGYDKKLTLTEPEKLEEALSSDLANVQKLFSDSTNGLAGKLDQMLTRVLGENGEVVNRQTSLTKQISEIDAQIARMEKTVQAESERMTRSFVAMEAAQARINQQLQYLTKNFQ